MHDNDVIRQKYELLSPLLNERLRRLWAAAEARALGRGGISRVSAATGLSPHTIRVGIRELHAVESGDPSAMLPGRVRQPGAGRKPRVVESPGLIDDLERLIEPVNEGDTKSPLRWTCEGTAGLAAQLQERGHTASPRLVANLLQQLGYTLQAKHRSVSGVRHADRGSQFKFLNGEVEAFHRRGHPVVVVTTCLKTTPLPLPAAEPPAPPPSEEKKEAAAAAPAPAAPEWAALPATADTAVLVVALLRYWWDHFGRMSYESATDLLVVSDVAGARGKINLAWKRALQSLADDTGLAISVCHLPHGTMRWARIEQSLSGFLDVEVGDERRRQQMTARVVGSLRSAAGMVLRPSFEGLRWSGPHGQTPPASLLVKPAEFYGEWNYTIQAHDDNDEFVPEPQTAS